ncbi:MAG: MoaD/ThiS family protein [Candidatus Jordarchaeum sp.]|uniref:MoaD/ThiS family protein n=1 Tax=Candidatus Jordarchaeum sp. TaxID=2823881 RepID=UPI004049634A
MIEVKFLTMLREIVGMGTIEIERKETIPLLIEYLCKKYGKKFSEAIVDEKGSLKEHVRIMLNGKEVKNLDARINEGDTVLIFVPIAGG